MKKQSTLKLKSVLVFYLSGPLNHFYVTCPFGMKNEGNYNFKFFWAFWHLRTEFIQLAWQKTRVTTFSLIVNTITCGSYFNDFLQVFMKFVLDWNFFLMFPKFENKIWRKRVCPNICRRFFVNEFKIKNNWNYSESVSMI